MKVAITGSTGLIGSRIIELLKNDVTFIPVSSQQLDIADQAEVHTYLESVDYDLLLHLAGYTNVDSAETDNDTAYRLNVTGTKNLFENSQNKQKKFMYFSTDFVFDGTNPPYYEDSPPNPLSFYGQTKYEGEQIVRGKAMIIRPAFPYRRSFAKKNDFVRALRNRLENGEQLRMVSDSLITPTFIDDIAYALRYLFNNFSPEIYHIVGPESISPFEAGIIIARTFGLKEDLIQPITYKEYSTGKAKRPQFSEMKTKKNTFYTMRRFADILSTF